MRKLVIISILTLTPALAFASPANFKELIGIFIKYVSLVTPIVFGMALLFFFWGIAKYIFSAGNENEKEDSKKIMLWGLIALFFMTSVLAIVTILGQTLLPKFNVSPDFNRSWNSTPEPLNSTDALPQELFNAQGQ